VVLQWKEIEKKKNAILQGIAMKKGNSLGLFVKSSKTEHKYPQFCISFALVFR
jgi:hypothetical protein